MAQEILDPAYDDAVKPVVVEDLDEVTVWHCIKSFHEVTIDDVHTAAPIQDLCPFI